MCDNTEVGVDEAVCLGKSAPVIHQTGGGFVAEDPVEECRHADAAAHVRAHAPRRPRRGHQAALAARGAAHGAARVVRVVGAAEHLQRGLHNFVD